MFPSRDDELLLADFDELELQLQEIEHTPESENTHEEAESKKNKNKSMTRKHKRKKELNRRTEKIATDTGQSTRQTIRDDRGNMQKGRQREMS